LRVVPLPRVSREETSTMNVLPFLIPITVTLCVYLIYKKWLRMPVKAQLSIRNDEPNWYWTLFVFLILLRCLYLVGKDLLPFAIYFVKEFLGL
jgi:hypothetical protein